jgi:putative membrane protein
MKQISEEDRHRLNDAVDAIKRRTSAHFALVVTPVSDRYSHYPLLWAAAITLVTGGVLGIVWQQLELRTGFLIEAATLASLALIFDWLPLRLLLVPARIKREHCVDLAHREFAARILADSEHRPGMLFFVSLGERYVEILADNALHIRVGEDVWGRIVADFVTALQADRLIIDGLIASLDACGSLLGKHYPPSVVG